MGSHTRLAGEPIPEKLMITRLYLFFIFMLPGLLVANELNDAETAANSIMNEISGNKYSEVYDNFTSNLLKDRVEKESFIANLSIPRNSLGSYSSGDTVDIKHRKGEPRYEYNGDVFTFTYKNKYTYINVYEQVVAINDDGKGYKLSGYWINQAPN